MEKDKRIYIAEIKPKGDYCPVEYGKCNSFCENCKGGISYTEAIERIKKQLKEQCWLNDCDSEDVAIECLNALLSKEK